MKYLINNLELSVSGKMFRLARLRHEWCDFVPEPTRFIENLKRKSHADLFTFIQDVGDDREFPLFREVQSASILKVSSWAEWFKDLDFKVRNKIRKAEKSGVELRSLEPDDTFVEGVRKIYNESPLRQGRRFYHYGKSAAEIKEELASFNGRTYFVGAYFNGELIGFLKLFHAAQVLRTIHIIARLDQRDKPVMDALISRAVQLCDEKRVPFLQYGSWTGGGVGAFREKHGFKKVDLPRYFVPLTLRGKLMLRCNLHRPIRERLPEHWVNALLPLRTKWMKLKYRQPLPSVETPTIEQNRLVA